jgi:very-short-patch-repair endonuclease
MSTTSDKAIQLFTYLKELCKLGTTHVKDVASYDQVLCFSDIPRERGCFCIAWSLWTPVGEPREDRGEVWIEVHKPRLKSAPEVPDDLEAWLTEEDLSNSALEEPRLRDEIVSTTDPDPETNEEETRILSINDCPDVFDAWMEFVEEKWKPWAQEDQRLQAVQKVYNELYVIYQRAEKLGEQYEVLVGLGFLLWRSPKSGEIRHPLLTLQARVGFDRVRGIMTVGPALDGPDPKLEIDMLETEDRPGVQDQEAIQEMVEKLEGEPWEDPALEDILKSLANGISTQSKYDRAISRPAQIGDIPQLHFAPLLILRKRSRRTFVDFYARIVEQLMDGGDVPENVRRLVEIVEDEEAVVEWDPNERSARTQIEDTETYFPLPANDEQRRIVQRIEQGRGVLVQGPPGTGKSHTIANLIAHFLAKGQTVLVTSETPRALEVLKEKLPKDIRDLCVMWLGSGPLAQKSLEASVHGITQKKVDWDPEREASELTVSRQRLDQTRRDQARLRADLTACREADTYRHTKVFGVYDGTLAQIASVINRERERFGWFMDRPVAELNATVTSDELLELRQVHSRLTESLVCEIKKRHLPLERLISLPEFRKLAAAEQRALALHEETAKKREYPGYESLQSMSEDSRARMLELLRCLANSRDELGKHVHAWVDRAACEVAADQDRVWRQLLENSEKHLRALADLSHEVSGLRIAGLEGRDHAEVTLHARELKAHLDGNGRLRSLYLFRPKVVRRAWYLVKKVHVEGEPCGSSYALKRLLDWLDFEKRLGDLASLWNAYTTPPDGNYSAQLAAYEDLCEPLRAAVALHETVQKLRALVSQLPGLASPHWHVRDDVEALRDAAEAVDVDEGLRKSRDAFVSLESRLREFLEKPGAHPATGDILKALRTRDILRYEEAYATVSQMCEWAQVYSRVSDIFRRFKASAPTTSAAYKASVRDAAWGERFKELRVAWNWAKTDRWLLDTCSDNRAKHLSDALERSQADERTILRKLAAQKAWEQSMTKLREPQRMALMAWMQAVRKIRGGTGRHAERYREEARQKLAECRKAIPAWVMPLYQVVQTTSPQKGLFDVVIVDEASQSGPEALLLNYIGDKIIVVGDDKQIAPLHVGVNRDDVLRLRQLHLKGIPHAEAFDLEGSFFSQAELRFPGRVRLREHFRCMPEIIQFSNKLSYSTEPLIPLRQFGADRLAPCKTTHVADGYRAGRSPNIVNEPEARALVDQIVECLEDPAYEGKSFGVISLLGVAQATLIANLLMQEAGAEEIERRKLLCGDPYDFQGDERDVIFLSMVDAPQDGRTCRMVRDEETQRRFNVAASRAKDQLWLFHSPTLNELRTECLRYRLLEHCLNPSVAQASVGDLDVLGLRRLAGSEARDRTNAPTPFDSWFEVDVFLKIAERGYRVLPQYEVAGRWIDLVVEGLDGRLAVECDGDEWHGPEQYDVDMRRQRELERCGWMFWRVRGSQFYRDSEVALQPLWELLKTRGIYPEQQWEEERRKRETGPPKIREDYGGNIEEEEGIAEFERGTTEDSRAGKPVSEGGGDRRDDTPVNTEGRLDRVLKYANGIRGKQRPETLSARTIQQAIVAALEKCPNRTCTAKSITSRTLKELGVVTRGNPRAEFDKRVKRNVWTLKNMEILEEYMAKNKRLRLLAKSRQSSLLG